MRKLVAKSVLLAVGKVNRGYSQLSYLGFPVRLGVKTGKTCHQIRAATVITGLIVTSAKTISGTFSGMARGEC